jgi:exodeoxyribonuclease VII large subunit
LHVVARRQPALRVILAPCRVQGDGAAAEIAAAIGLLNQWSQPLGPGQRLDLILVTRGGGSLEDLWAFNEEIVARAIFDSALPVVSAIGHEIDFTISDFVADVRAATPSAAAEIITEGMFTFRQALAQTRRRLSQLMAARLEADRDQLQHLGRRLERVHPRRRVAEQWQHLDELQSALSRSARQSWRLHQTAWSNLRQRLGRLRPAGVIAQRRQTVQEWARRLAARPRAAWEDRRARLGTLRARLELLGPENVLARGYSITMDEASGRVVRAEAETRAGQRLRTRLNKGEVRSVVEGRRV